MSDTANKYIVTRNGVRVSDQQYDSKKEANEEYMYWLNIVKRWPDGSEIKIQELKVS